MKPITSYTKKLENGQPQRLREVLSTKAAFKQESAPPYAAFAMSGPQVKVVMYESGKLVVQGKGVEEFVTFILEPDVLEKAEFGYELELEPEQLDPRIGVDESGKGDFFGPLCVAAVYVNEMGVRALDAAGVQDSKNIGSDKRIRDLAGFIRSSKGVVVEELVIGCEAYNRLYSKMKNVNKLLAWGHAKAIENLLERSMALDPAPVRAVCDQFARSEARLKSAMLEKGRQLELVQRHKAESDMAVAAASIMARERFVNGLERLSGRFELDLPKGASGKVDQAALRFLEKHGKEALHSVGKLHFKTAERAIAIAEGN